MLQFKKNIIVFNLFAIIAFLLFPINANATCVNHSYKMKVSEEALNTAATCENASTYFYTCETCGNLSDEYFSYGKGIGHFKSQEYSYEDNNGITNGHKYKTCLNDNCDKKIDSYYLVEIATIEGVKCSESKYYKKGDYVKITSYLEDGYTWVGYTGSINEINQVCEFTMPSKAVSIIPTVKTDILKIDYLLNGGKVSTPNPTEITTKTNTFVLNNPTKKGSAFIGWTGSNGNIPQKKVKIKKGQYENLSFLANWRQDVLGDTFIYQNAKYKITQLKDGYPKEVEYLQPTNESIKTIIIPNKVILHEQSYKVVSINKKAFKNNSKITSFSTNKYIKTIPKALFKDCEKLKKVYINKNIRTIEEAAFKNCTKLSNIIFGSKVKSIEKDAFQNCKNIKKINISNVTSIGENVFENNKKLQYVKIGEKVTSIKQNAFKNCKKLKKVVIESKKLKELGNNVFLNTNKKISVHLNKKLKYKFMNKYQFGLHSDTQKIKFTK